MRRARLVIAMLMAIAPAAAGGQTIEPSARIDAALAAAARAEIPVSLLESKVNEGRAKGVAEARIAQAVEARLDALVRARSALERGRAHTIAAADLAVAADALQAGVSEAAVVEVMTRAPAERRAVATAVLTELVQLGVGSDVALGRVRAALAQGGGALVNLPAQAADNARARGNDARARGHGRAGVNVDAGPPIEVDAAVRGNADNLGRGRRGGNRP